MDESLEYKLPVDLQPTPTNTSSSPNSTSSQEIQNQTPNQADMSHTSNLSTTSVKGGNNKENVHTTPNAIAPVVVSKSKPPVRPSATPTRPKPPPMKSTQNTASGPQLPARPSEGHPLYIYMSEVPHAIAKYDYQAQDEVELSFKVSCCCC